MWRWQVLGLSVAGLMVAGCGTIEVPSTCAPVGQRLICNCSDGAEGEQQCTASGQLTVCDCTPPTNDVQADLAPELPQPDSGPDSVVDADIETEDADTDDGVADDGVADDGVAGEVDGGTGDIPAEMDVPSYQCGPPGAVCDDGDGCTNGDTCSDTDLCVGTPVICAPDSTCNPIDGSCESDPECQLSSDCPQPACGQATCIDELCVDVDEPNTVAVFDGAFCGQIQEVFPGGDGEVDEATVELWLRLDDTDQPARIIDGSNGPGGFQLEWLPFVGLRFEGDGAHPVTVSGLQEGVWYHVAAVVDGAQTTLFIDGAVVDTNEKANFLEIAEPYIGLGCIYSGGGPQGADRFEGAIDDLRISTVARYVGSFLSPEEPHLPDENTWVLVDFEGPSFQDASPNKFACVWDGLPEYSTQGPYCSSP